MAWKPPTKILRHSGEPVDQHMKFVVPPPTEIGELVSVGSTISAKTLSGKQRLLVVLGIVAGFVVGAAIVGAIWESNHHQENSTLISTVVGLLLGIVFGLVWYFDKNKLSVSYVGEKGAAIYYFKSSVGEPHESKVLLFSDASDLAAKSKAIFVNNGFVRTNYKYTWTDSRSEPLFVLEGFCRKEIMDPVKLPDDLYFFGLACEEAYNNSKVHVLADQLEKTGRVEFSCGNDTITVGTDAVTFCKRGVVNRVPYDEIESVFISDGTFEVESKDASFFSGKGKYHFPYHAIGNAQLMFSLLEIVGGLEINSYSSAPFADLRDDCD